MRKTFGVLFELASGLVLVAVCFLGEEVLLQSRSLVYTFLPLLGLAAAGLGVWRGRASALAAWQVVVLLNLPLALLVWYAAGRAKGLLSLAVVGVAFTVIGIAGARGPAAWRSWRVALPGLAIATLVLAALGPPFARSLVVSREVREPAVQFQVTVPAGTSMTAMTAGQLRGRVAVIDFWATWCQPCRRELPELERLSRRLAGDRRVVFYAVDVPVTDSPDAPGDTPAQAIEFFHRRGFSMPLAYDTGGHAAEALHVHGLPTLLVLDRAGRVRLRHVGFAGAENLGETLTAAIEKLLAESPG